MKLLVRNAETQNSPDTQVSGLFASQSAHTALALYRSVPLSVRQIGSCGEKRMKHTKNILSWVIIALNIVGVVCLICFAIPYFTRNVTITNPDAMLPAEAWDSAGMALTLGFIPLLIANILCFVVVKTKQEFMSFLYFIPSVVCFITVLSYWIAALG